MVTVPFTAQTGCGKISRFSGIHGSLLYNLQWSRLRRIVTCIGPNQKNQPNLDLYLYLRYIFSQLLLMVSVSKYLKDTEDTPFMYLYLVRRYKIFVSVATLVTCNVPFSIGINKEYNHCPLPFWQSHFAAPPPSCICARKRSTCSTLAPTSVF